MNRERKCGRRVFEELGNCSMAFSAAQIGAVPNTIVCEQGRRPVAVILFDSIQRRFDCVGYALARPSATEAALRFRPPRPTARDSSAVSASISVSTRFARATFPRLLASSSSSRNSPNGVCTALSPGRRASRLHRPGLRYESPTTRAHPLREEVKHLIEPRYPPHRPLFRG